MGDSWNVTITWEDGYTASFPCPAVYLLSEYIVKEFNSNENIGGHGDMVKIVME